MNKSIWQRCLIMLCACLVSTLSLTACETTKGAGRDIERAGEEMEDAVD